MLPWQPFLAFYIWGAHWRQLKNTTELSMFRGDAALCQITLTTCSRWLLKFETFNGHLKRAELCRSAKFGRNRSKCCQGMTIFRFFQDGGRPPSWICYV